MADRRIKLIWGGQECQPGEWKLGLWGTYERNPGSRLRDVVISGRGILRWIAGLTMAGYLAGATALYFWFEQRPNNFVTYTDTLLLPMRWSRIQELRGRGYIEEGLADLKTRHWADAHLKLRLGLSKYPRELRARLALANFYRLSEQRPLALQTLKEGLVYGYPGRSYLTEMFKIATDGEDYDLIIAACDRFLPTETNEHGWLLVNKLQALNGARRYAEVLQLSELQGTSSAGISECRVIALLEQARFDEALRFLDVWLASAPSQQPVVLRLRVRAFRDLKQVERMEQAIEEFRALEPTDPKPYLYGIVQRALAGEPERATAALENYFMRFGGTQANLEMLAEPLADARQPRLLQRCLDEATAHGFPTKLYKSSMVLLLLQEGNSAGARRLLDEIKPALVRNNFAEMFWYEWVQQIIGAVAASEEAPAAGLIGLFQSRSLPLKIYRHSSTILVRAQRLQAARAVLNQAARDYPASSTLAVIRNEIDLAIAAREIKPTVPAAVVTVQTEKAFFQNLDMAEKQKRWNDAAEIIRAMRVAKPTWLGKREAELFSAQMRVALETGDFPELLSAARLYLDGSTEHSQRVVGVARILHDRGARSDATLLLYEVFRRSPDFPPARRLRTEWEPKPLVPHKK